LDPIDVLQSVSILRGRACHWFASGRGRSEHECHVLGREHFKVVVQEMNCGTDPANVPRLDCYIHYAILALDVLEGGVRGDRATWRFVISVARGRERSQHGDDTDNDGAERPKAAPIL
jgi:hypothetical protein